MFALFFLWSCAPSFVFQSCIHVFLMCVWAATRNLRSPKLAATARVCFPDLDRHYHSRPPFFILTPPLFYILNKKCSERFLDIIIKILVFPSPTNYMLQSWEFSSLMRYVLQNPLKWWVLLLKSCTSTNSSITPTSEMYIQDKAHCPNANMMSVAKWHL